IHFSDCRPAPTSLSLQWDIVSLGRIVTRVSHPILAMGLASAAAALFVAAAGRADDWQQWRGPNRDGVWSETGIPEKFPREGLKARWRAPVGPGWSSPVIVQGRVYVTDSELRRPKAKERVLCFSEASGKPLWTYAFYVSYPDWAFRPGEE